MAGLVPAIHGLGATWRTWGCPGLRRAEAAWAAQAGQARAWRLRPCQVPETPRSDLLPHPPL